MHMFFPASTAGKKSISRLLFRFFQQCLLISVVITTAGMLFLSSGAYAATAVPGKPAGLGGTSGSQQVTLHWGAVSGATSYLVQQSDLVSGQTQVRAAGSGTSVTLTGLAVGHWYRFTVSAVAGTTQGPASDPLEIRTTGFSGSYSNYYALGDSYASGDGAQPYSGVASCYQSTKGYPYLLAAGAPAPVVFACAGASTDNIDKTVQSSSLPGTQLSQLQNSPRGNTLITITIGGNDIGFSSEIKNCIISFSSCTSRRSTISQKISALEPRLVQVYQELRAAAPSADIVAVGYPLVVADPTIAHCHNPIVYVGLSGSEMQMIRDLATQLDSVVAQAANQAGVSYSTELVQQAFAGHEACTANESQEWINEIAGLNDSLSDSFHPSAPGYQVFAGAVDSSRNALYQSGLVRN